MTHTTYRPHTTADERTGAMLSHLATIISMVISVGWLSFVGPLVMWLLNKDRSPFVRRAAAGSFNFNIGMWVMTIVGWICVFTVVLLPVGLVLMAIAAIATLWCHIKGAFRASRGETYDYPFQIRILS
ncbi:DUF4870 domain-containing protein [Aestuariimicrobium ganziense]|uniref:DUF4870 domain-containing protein n=1 Tax=Aestuariimicrobium ganziense TaxID=2773677 RepID=UPI0019404C71|nr:DUF4870 domain-containing protein [Aestuariimicrobium ganziense]